MPTITATVNEPMSWVRLDVNFADIAAPYVRVVRVNETTGVETVVRTHGSSSTGSDGLEYQNLAAGFTTTLYDTEVPLDTPVHYVARAILSQVNTTATFDTSIDPWTPANGASLARRLEAGSAYGPWTLAVIPAGTNNPQAVGERILVTPGAIFTLTGVAFRPSVSVTAISAVAIGMQWLDASLAVLSTSTIAGTSGMLYEVTTTGNVTAPASAVYGVPLVQTTASPVPAADPATQWRQILVQSQAGSATSAAVVCRSEGACWLKDPYDPGQSIKVNFCFDPSPLCTPTEGVFFASMDVEQYAANSGTFNINNQAEPVTVAKTRQSRSSTLTLVTRTLADRDRLLAMLSGGYPLLWQVPDEYGIPDAYLAIGATQVARILPDHRFPVRVFPLPFVVEKSPGGPMYGVPGARWLDSCNRYATWGAATAASVTWTQAIQGALG